MFGSLLSRQYMLYGRASRPPTLAQGARPGYAPRRASAIPSAHPFQLGEGPRGCSLRTGLSWMRGGDGDAGGRGARGGGWSWLAVRADQGCQGAVTRDPDEFRPAARPTQDTGLRVARVSAPRLSSPGPSWPGRQHGACHPRRYQCASTRPLQPPWQRRRRLAQPASSESSEGARLSS